MRERALHSKVLLLGSFLLLITGCTSIPFLQERRAYSRIFLTDYSTAWGAALEAVSNARDVNQNRDLGTIQTGWITNTESRNFREAFSAEDFYRRARYRLFLRIREGKKHDQRAVVVRVQKEQEVEKSPFSTWEIIESSGTDEAIYLYRIGRLIALQEYTDKKDEESSKNFNITF